MFTALRPHLSAGLYQHATHVTNTLVFTSGDPTGVGFLGDLVLSFLRILLCGSESRGSSAGAPSDRSGADRNLWGRGANHNPKSASALFWSVIPSLQTPCCKVCRNLLLEQLSSMLACNLQSVIRKPHTLLRKPHIRQTANRRGFGLEQARQLRTATPY